MNNYAQQLGYEFENYINTILMRCKNNVILNEKETKAIYGTLASGIDHLIYNNNIIIGIQDKWSKNKIGLCNINHFIQCLDMVQKTENKIIIGIYISKIGLTKGSIQSLEYSQNTSNKSKYYYNISGKDHNNIQQQLSQLLYSLNVYFYDADGSTIMLD